MVGRKQTHPIDGLLALSLRGPKDRGNLLCHVQQKPSAQLRLARFARNDTRTLAVLVVALCLSTLAQAAPRKAAVYYSDGKVLTGRISLTSGRKFKLNIPAGGKLKTSDMITGEAVQYGKVRQFTFDPVREIRFHPEREEIRQDWKFVETTKYDEKTAIADFSPAKKEFWGETYPLRYL
ncbi:MAG: hypothetical protein ACYS7Y_16140, partial [Planctomycetota bacterium]